MNYQIEVCIDNLESLHLAIQGGATRIELCSSLALGGLTPSYGFMQQAAKYATVPVYAMIRPRQGDFLYSSEDIDCMICDIEAAAKAGLQGVVFGVLDAQGHVDLPVAQRLSKRAKALNLGVTFHRAVDQCSDVRRMIEDIATLGCERILTSGLASNAYQGKATLKQMVELAGDRFAIMAGAGLNAGNVKEIVAATGITQVHLSGKSVRPSKMNFVSEQAKMGNSDTDDFSIPVTNPDLIQAVVKQLSSLD
ncbi:copper homeostasis protein CutC [Vibrio sp. TRT 21S02]|uniref:copper homeostasis protein CutC n=1 Tax=Vibrio sp. TRT 21S02 TaxID=3418507 RepID=UPI003CEFD275